MKTLTIIRGLPGSGKSTLADMTCKKWGIPRYFETDQYMIEPDGSYVWSPERLTRAIDLCQEAVGIEMVAGAPRIVVAGVFSSGLRTMQDYLDMALEYGYEVTIVQCLGEFENIHNVPVETLEKMKKNFVPNSEIPLVRPIVSLQNHYPVEETGSF